MMSKGNKMMNKIFSAEQPEPKRHSIHIVGSQDDFDMSMSECENGEQAGCFMVPGGMPGQEKDLRTSLDEFMPDEYRS